MSQPSLLHPQSTPSPHNRPPSTKSGKQAIGKSLKRAFSRRKTSGSIRIERDDSEFDLSSRRSGSIGPESFVSNDPLETQVSEEAILDNSDLSPQRGRSPSRRLLTDPPEPSPPRRKSRSLPRQEILPITISPLPRSSGTSPAPKRTQEVPREPKPTLSLQTAKPIPSMSITPATPINPPTAPSTPDKLIKDNLPRQRSWSKLNNALSSTKEDKPPTASGSVGAGVWGSLVNAANKVTDTLSSLTSPNNPAATPQLARSVSPATTEQSDGDSLSRPRSQTLPSTSTVPFSPEETINKIPKQMAIDTLGEGELSLKELGFESDTSHIPGSSGESSKSVQDEMKEGGQGLSDFSKPLKTTTTELAVPVEHKKVENISRSRRSLTVPAKGIEVANENDRRLTTSNMKTPRRLGSVSKRSGIRQNESATPRVSSDAAVVDDVNRRAKKRSSLTAAETALGSPKSKTAGTPDVPEDRENEDGLYIHGKDGKKRRVPITGFAVQSGKRNRDFHSLFKSVEESDYLIEDYSCALSREILVQGRMYVSEHYICFNSNIFGWVTNLVIAFTEVVSIEKRSTAVLFPNGIQITTLHAKYVFASFVGRDGTYDLLTSIWRLSHPDSRSPDDVYPDDSESASPSSGSFSDDENSLSEGEEDVSFNSNLSEEAADEGRTTAKTAAVGAPFPEKGDETEAGSSLGITGPETHDKTECDCGKDGHYDKVVCDEVVRAPLGKVWNCVFGDNKEFMITFMRDHERVQEITLGDWKIGEGAKRERQVSYIKPLNNPMGPKQTKCNITEQVQVQDFNSSCVALTNTTTPDVPSGSSFQVLTKFCMMWAGGSATRILITCTIEWSKSSWIKGAIEKGVNDGQSSFAKGLIGELRKRLEGGTPGAKRKLTGKKKSGKRKREERRDDEGPTEVKKDRTRIFGKVQETAENVVDLIAPMIKLLFSSASLISVLLIMVFYALIRVERTMRELSAESSAKKGANQADVSLGLIENELWDWIDTRIGSVSKNERDGRLIWNNLAREGAPESGLQEIEDAIRTTEGKLNALKAVVEKRKS